MITLGVANAVCSCLIGCAQRHVHREALVAIGCVLHAALIIFLLVWIPDRHLLAVFFVLSALWGFCEAIWQTQSNGQFNKSVFHMLDDETSRFTICLGKNW